MSWLGNMGRQSWRSGTAAGEMMSFEKTEIEARVIALQQEHRDLDGAIDAMVEKGAFDQLQLQRMKKRKLSLRDLIGRLEAHLVPDIIA